MKLTYKQRALVHLKLAKEHMLMAQDVLQTDNSHFWNAGHKQSIYKSIKAVQHQHELLSQAYERLAEIEPQC